MRNLEKISIVCKTCNKEFKIYPYRAMTAKYCSRKCQSKKVIIICKTCNKEFEVTRNRAGKAKFCSKSCKGKYQINQYADYFFRDKHGLNHPLWGKKHKPESIEKMRASAPDRRGDKSPSWKGGVNTKNETIRKSKEYTEWRRIIFTRDNYTCQLCGKRGVSLEADHIKPFSLYPELRFELSNGQTLCQSCHSIKNSQDMKLIRREADHLWKKCLVE